MVILSDPQKRKQHDMGMSGDDIQNGGSMPDFGGMGGMPGGFSFGGPGMGGMGGGRGGGGMAFDPNEIFKMFMAANM